MDEARAKLDDLRIKAEDGDPEAMFLLGIAYAEGRGVDRNDTAAARWFHQASRKGHSRAKTSMGYLYSIGRGVRQDSILGYVLLSQVAETGDNFAQDMLHRLEQKLSQEQLVEAKRRAFLRRQD
ncbi:MAG: tetratricopeptide repeat protein [Pseudomonadota bacterium]